MSLFGSMTSGVSGLRAQSSAMGAISDNITNVNTVGYKNVHTNFQTLVTKQTSVTYYSAGGVQARPLQMNDVQGLLQATTSQTDVGISGAGYFVVNEAAQPGVDDQFLFTRAGSFYKDEQGFLRNAAGFYLQAWPTDPAGEIILPSGSNAALTNQNIISTDFLETVNLNRVGGSATETSTIAMGANLPATAPDGDSQSIDVQFFDTLGTTNDVSFNFTKTGANAWDLTVEPPTGTSVVTLHGPIGDYSDVYKSVGQLEFTSQPAEGAFVAVDGIIYEFDTNGTPVFPGATLVTIGGDLAATVTNLVSRVEATHPNFSTALTGGHRVTTKPGNATVALFTGGDSTVLGNFNLTFPTLNDASGNPAVRQSAATTSFDVYASDATGPAIGFDAQGLPNELNAVKMSVVDFTNGSADMNNVDLDGDGDVDVTQIDLDFGTIGEANGMTQYGSDFLPAFIEQNGARFGTFAGVSISEEGLVTALFDNGELRPIFQVPVATFVNPNGLGSRTGNVWNATDTSGDPTLRTANKGPAGTINQASLESSTVDIGEEFTDMIIVQRAYSAATKIITTADDMLEELVRIK